MRYIQFIISKPVSPQPLQAVFSSDQGHGAMEMFCTVPLHGSFLDERQWAFPQNLIWNLNSLSLCCSVLSAVSESLVEIFKKQLAIYDGYPITLESYIFLLLGYGLDSIILTLKCGFSLLLLMVIAIWEGSVYWLQSQCIYLYVY